MSELRYDGKVAIVTGGGRGVGREHALLLARRGAKVVIVDPGVELDGTGSSNGPAAEVAAEIKAFGGEAIAAFEKVNDEVGVKRAVEAAMDSWGQIDIVVNNAGNSIQDTFDLLSIDAFRAMLDVHYIGTVLMTKAAWPYLTKAKHPRLVNTVSEGAVGLHEKGTGYGGAKGGVIGFTLTLATERHYHGVNVNGFSPRTTTRLSSPEVMSHVYNKPVEMFAKSWDTYPASHAAPVAMYLAHESCELNGVMLAGGGGVVIRLAFMENEGLRYQGDDISLETMAANIDRIIDMDSAVNVGIGAGAKGVITNV